MQQLQALGSSLSMIHAAFTVEVVGAWGGIHTYMQQQQVGHADKQVRLELSEV